jgi:hypothetical protein
VTDGDTPAAALARYSALHEDAVLRAGIAKTGGDETDALRWREIAVYWRDRRHRFRCRMEQEGTRAAQIPSLLEHLDIVERHLRDTTAFIARQVQRPGPRRHHKPTAADERGILELFERHLRILRRHASLTRSEISKRIRG